MSTSISGRMASEIKDEVSRLLGRGRAVFVCPLDEEERQRLWHGMLAPELVNSFEVLERFGHNTNVFRTFALRFDTLLQGESYCINFWNPGEYRLIAEHQDAYRSAERIVAAFPRPVEDWPAFVQWVQNTGCVERDFTAALEALESILGFCNTIGQLTRAVPELAQYLSTEKREILQGQKRASNMPFEWATFDRKRVDTLQFAMAKAHLMPVKNNTPWQEINSSRAVLTETSC